MKGDPSSEALRICEEALLQDAQEALAFVRWQGLDIRKAAVPIRTQQGTTRHRIVFISVRTPSFPRKTTKLEVFKARKTKKSEIRLLDP